MPELPEVETVLQGLRPFMEGARFSRVELRRSDLRFPFPSRFGPRLEGRQVISMERRAKYLLSHLDDGATLLVHLGMSGRFSVLSGTDAAIPGRFHNALTVSDKHEHVVFHMSGSTGARDVRLGYTDPRRFGIMDLIGPGGAAGHRLLVNLGMEPLGPDLRAAALAESFAGRRAPLKSTLLDQRIIAGLGNIYVCEALHRARLSPMRSAMTLSGPRSRKKLEKLVAAITATLKAAIVAGGSTLRDFAGADGSLGYFQHSFRVYDREGLACPRPDCDGTVRKDVQSARSTYWCARCQK